MNRPASIEEARHNIKRAYGNISKTHDINFPRLPGVTGEEINQASAALTVLYDLYEKHSVFD